jgi:PhzF family phenazine biosynthesis protein
MPSRPFRQVDVFTTTPYLGNPVAVVHDAGGIDPDVMQRAARWTNLSETTYLLPPSKPGADYQVRIFTPSRELPFAGHPTLGSAHAWMEAGGKPAEPGRIVQECAAGLIPLRRTGAGLAFAAPPLVRSGPLGRELTDRITGMLGVDPSAVVDAEWVDNGPGWAGVLLDRAETVLALQPGPVSLDIGVVGPHPAGAPEQFEVRAFFPQAGSTAEDPVTGSLNASLAEWLIRTGRAAAPYMARQGTVLGRAGRVHITQDPDGTIWTGGGTITCIRGDIDM